MLSNKITKNVPFIVILIGIILIFDGIISILFQIDESFLFQFGRIVRIFLGLFLIIIIWLIYYKKKEG
ncbi:hypothetical protein LCGC14_1824910 [marine sediment metagenome]|uniref:Uncharacterized protein n=1 Tax=marine sediment metagenome TaxID=412755 RepID=A0A0F9GHT3_9ZZZZ